MTAGQSRPEPLVAGGLPYSLRAHQGIWYLDHGCGRKWEFGDGALVEHIIAEHERIRCQPLRGRPVRDIVYLAAAALVVLYAIGLVLFSAFVKDY